MKYLVGFVGMTVLFQTALSQINWGPAYKLKSRDYLEYVVYGDTNGIKILRSRYNFVGSKSLFLDNYDPETFDITHQSALITAVTHKDAGIPYKSTFEQILPLNHKLLLFQSSYNPERDRNNAYVQYLDEYGTPSGEAIPIGNIKAERRANRGRFSFTTSYSGSYILMYSHEPYERYTDEKFGFTLLDENLEVVWENEYSLPLKNRDFNILDYKADDYGNAYMLSQIYFTKEQRLQKNLPEDAFYFTLHQFGASAAKNDYHEVVFSFEDKYLLDMSFRFTPEQNMVFTGFYRSKTDKAPTVSGLYYFVVKQGNTQPEQVQFHTFEKGFVGEFDLDIPLRFGEVGIPELLVKNMYINSDGSLTLIAEHQFVSEYCVTDYRTALTTCTYNFYFNDLYAIHISPEGEILWKLKIPKRQFTRNDDGVFSSYISAFNDDYIYLFYNDHARNLKPEQPGKFYTMTDPRKAYAYCVRIDPKGRVQKSVLQKNQDEKVWFRPGLTQQISATQLLVGATRSGHYRWGWFTLQKDK